MQPPAIACTALLLSACAAQPMQPAGPRIGDVAEASPVEQPVAATDTPSTASAADAYRRVEGTLPDSIDNRSIERRIAELDQRLGTQRSTGDESYRDAIARYEKLLKDPNVHDRDVILYQLAQTYDLLGDLPSSNRYLDELINDYPDSPFRIEAHFRRAERAFSVENLELAEADYRYVLEHGQGTSFWQNAGYMLGWTYLKQGDYDRSLDRFLICIDGILGKGNDLDRGSREMVDDAIRGAVLDVNYLDGPKSLANHLERIDKPAWQYLVYQQLAKTWRDKERYHDSVEALETFVERNPYDARAPEFSKLAVDILTEAAFPSEVRKYKQDYIERYRFDGEYWVVNGTDRQASIAPTYKAYLMEIAKLMHSDAQHEHQRSRYLAAADYYHRFATTFPDDALAGDALFLEGEALTDAGEPARAATAYQQVIHDYPHNAHAADAGYAVILAFETMLKNADPADQKTIRRSKIDAQVEYATLFPSAPHAAEAEGDAADQLYAMHEYDEAAKLSEHLLTRKSGLPLPVKRIAILILAQIAFEQEHYDVAETRYRQALALPGSGTDRELKSRLLAAIYKQGEAAEARGDVDAAVLNYRRIADEDPASELAQKGQFDAAAVYEAAGRWGEAADQLAAFRKRYPDNPLANNTDLRLADLYEKAGRLSAAAASLRTYADAHRDETAAPQALYHAGELYDGVDPRSAIACFEDYEARYPTPRDVALEGAHRLEALYERLGDADAQTRWLQTQVDITAAMGDKATDRARSLAAHAQFDLAMHARSRFDSIGLSGNLAQSLAAKRTALTQTVAEFQKSAGYGIEEIATASTYEIADTYAALARDLLHSTAPAGLSDLEREQYEVLLEEQATPFEDQAIAIHQINVDRIADGVYDDWISKSLDALRQLAPARYDRPETDVGFVDSIR